MGRIELLEEWVQVLTRFYEGDQVVGKSRLAHGLAIARLRSVARSHLLLVGAFGGARHGCANVERATKIACNRPGSNNLGGFLMRSPPLVSLSPMQAFFT